MIDMGIKELWSCAEESDKSCSSLDSGQEILALMYSTAHLYITRTLQQQGTFLPKSALEIEVRTPRRS